ncbi:MAG: protein-disulfide reductase DsbD N-terminal domain-containing protein [Burkholderiales bacterium]
MMVLFARLQRRAPDAVRAASLALALAAVAASAHAVTPDELLEPEKAFRISTQPLDERSLQVRFEIAEGYYMYRDRFKFESESGRVLADVELPPGERKRDPFFGETVTYRRQVAMRVPLSEEDVVRGRVKLKVTSQGCLDQRVCYAPLEQMVEVRLASASPAASTTLGDTRGTQQADGSTTIAPASPPFWALIALLFATAGLVAAVALALLRKRRKPE